MYLSMYLSRCLCLCLCIRLSSPAGRRHPGPQPSLHLSKRHASNQRPSSPTLPPSASPPPLRPTHLVFGLEVRPAHDECHHCLQTPVLRSQVRPRFLQRMVGGEARGWGVWGRERSGVSRGGGDGEGEGKAGCDMAGGALGLGWETSIRPDFEWLPVVPIRPLWYPSVVRQQWSCFDHCYN